MRAVGGRARAGRVHHATNCPHHRLEPKRLARETLAEGSRKTIARSPLSAYPDRNRALRRKGDAARGFLCCRGARVAVIADGESAWQANGLDCGPTDLDGDPREATCAPQRQLPCPENALRAAFAEQIRMANDTLRPGRPRGPRRDAQTGTLWRSLVLDDRTLERIAPQESGPPRHAWSGIGTARPAP